MSEAIKVEIVSPENLVFSQEVSSITIPGTEGYFTVMGEHAPLMSILRHGFVTVKTEKETTGFYVGGGFVDVSPDGVSILAEVAKTSEDFSATQIEQEIKNAKEKLEQAKDDEEISAAQIVLDGFKNFADEVKNMKPTGF
jgi:F-type H+-transporting ATPase subunit epsilon